MTILGFPATRRNILQAPAQAVGRWENSKPSDNMILKRANLDLEFFDRQHSDNVNNGEINPNDLQVRHRQGGAALLGRGATDREVTFVRRASLDLMTCPYPMLSAFTSKC